MYLILFPKTVYMHIEITLNHIPMQNKNKRTRPNTKLVNLHKNEDRSFNIFILIKI